MPHRLDSRKHVLTVGDVARRSRMAVSTVHFYEAKGLIQGWRTAGNQRRFSRDVLRRIAIIDIAQRAGLSLSDIRAALDTLPATGKASKDDWARLSSAWRDHLDARINALQALKHQLEGCIGCGCLSLSECPLRNPDDVMAQDSHEEIMGLQFDSN